MGGRGYSSATSRSRSAAQDKKLNSIANKIRNYKKEQLFIVDENGEVVFHKKGENGSVSYKVGEAREFFSGNIGIHNHPHGGTFSSADLSDFGYGIKEIRVAAPEGTYILTNKKFGKKEQHNGWYDMRERLDSTKFLNSWESRNQAQTSPKLVRMREKMSITARRWNAARDSGNEAKAESLRKKYTELDRSYRTAVETETNKVFYGQYHDFFKTNAKTYGFEYKFVKK